MIASPAAPIGKAVKRRRGNGPGVRGSSVFRDDYIPLRLAVHEAGHVIARIQLVAAWRLTGLDNPECLESVGVWLDRGNPKGRCRWGYREPLSFRYQAIISAAGPVAEAQIRAGRALRLPNRRRGL
jgi:hypothetical protein